MKRSPYWKTTKMVFIIEADSKNINLFRTVKFTVKNKIDMPITISLDKIITLGISNKLPPISKK